MSVSLVQRGMNFQSGSRRAFLEFSMQWRTLTCGQDIWWDLFR